MKEGTERGDTTFLMSRKIYIKKMIQQYDFHKYFKNKIYVKYTQINGIRVQCNFR